MSQLQQTDISYTATGCIVAGFADTKLQISAGAAAGTLSKSATIRSAGVAPEWPLRFSSNVGVPGTASWVGAFTMRLNVTTANANFTWSELQVCSRCYSNSAVTTTVSSITITSGLAIGLGTTGVKTASCEVTLVHVPACGTASTNCEMLLKISSAAIMNGVFNFISNQLVDFPFTASAAPAASITYTLAQLGVGN